MVDVKSQHSMHDYARATRGHNHASVSNNSSVTDDDQWISCTDHNGKYHQGYDAFIAIFRASPILFMFAPLLVAMRKFNIFLMLFVHDHQLAIARAASSPFSYPSAPSSPHYAPVGLPQYNFPPRPDSGDSDDGEGDSDSNGPPAHLHSRHPTYVESDGEGMDTSRKQQYLANALPNVTRPPPPSYSIGSNKKAAQLVSGSRRRRQVRHYMKVAKKLWRTFTYLSENIFVLVCLWAVITWNASVLGMSQYVGTFHLSVLRLVWAGHLDQVCAQPQRIHSTPTHRRYFKHHSLLLFTTGFNYSFVTICYL